MKHPPIGQRWDFDESYEEWLSRCDPDPDEIYESWRDRKAERLEAPFGPLRHLDEGVMSTPEDEP